ncbi:PAS domain S-box protein [Natronoarchaeum sp. GCM10025321]|uniref:PAS domain S-box protein n=1 Tax=Natronoarchaeum sp. GCM10025321 TaxID=3252684 RepID=UPI00361F4362
MTQLGTPPIGPSETSETVQLLVADAGNRSAISRMLDDRFEVETSQTVTDADLYLIEDHRFSEYRVALRDRIEQEDPAFCPVVLIQRESTDLTQENKDPSAHGGGVPYDEVVDAPIDPPQLIRRLNSLLVRRQQSQELMQQVSTLEEREQRLRRFEQAVESTGNGIVMTDSAGTIEYMNLALESITGYTEDEVLGESPQILLPEGAGGVFDEEFWQTLADQEEWEGDFIIEGKDSQRLVVNATATALQDVKNETEGFVIVLSDITERIQREQDLEDREEELDLLRQILTRYLRHNMRNTLNVIQGNAELLTEDETLSQKQIESVETIIENADALSEMSDTARTYSSLLGRDTELSTFDLSKITTKAVQRVRQDHSDVTFELDVPETCEIRARDGIQRAFEELIDNAARHNDATKPWVHIQVRDDDGARLVIEDNGPGINTQEMEAFEKRTETPLTHSQGVGLWLSKWLIEGVEGELSIEITDTGTRVTVDFPSLAKIGSTGQEITTLKEREQRLQTIKDRMTDAIIEVDADFTVTQLDERAERIYDKEAATVLGQRLWDVFPTLADTQFQSIIRNAMESRSSTSVEGYLEEIDTGLEIAIYPEFDGGLTFYTRDVTERKKQQKVLTRNTRAMDEAPIGITLTDPSQADNPLIYVNDRFQELTGYSDAEVLGRNCRFLQGEATDPELVARMREAVDNEDSVSVELRNYRKDGTEFWNRVSIAPVRDDDGSVVNYVGFQQDISDQRRRDRALREMYDIISDRHQSFEDKVQALLELGRSELNTEYGTLSEIRGDEYLFEFVATDDDSIRSGDVVPVSVTNCELVASSEETLVAGDIERDAPEQTDRAGFTEWGISCYLGAPVFTGDEVYGSFCFYGTEARSDQFSEWQVTLVDLMSRWVSYELQHREAKEQLQQTNERLDQFTSVVSHDLRNPLNVAEGRLEMVNKECDNDHLDPIGRALGRMDTLITDLLALAREGKSTTDITSIKSSRLAENCWRNVDTKDASIVTDIDRTIRADEGRLSQVFENFIRNAVEHGGGEVTVRIGELDDGFYIEDDGPGIPVAEHKDVFDAGYSTSDEGTGFGLSIVKQVVDAHGWEIHLTEGSDGGARFEITGVVFAAE